MQEARENAIIETDPDAKKIDFKKCYLENANLISP